MAQFDAKPEHEPGQRWLCSHLVTLSHRGEPALSETTLLEEISSEQAWLSTETPYPPGSHVEIVAAGLEAAALVTDCRQREDGFCLTVQFEGFRWSPEVWKPDHLFKPPRRGAKRKGAAGR